MLIIFSLYNLVRYCLSSGMTRRALYSKITHGMKVEVWIWCRTGLRFTPLGKECEITEKHGSVSAYSSNLKYSSHQWQERKENLSDH